MGNGSPVICEAIAGIQNSEFPIHHLPHVTTTCVSGLGAARTKRKRCRCKEQCGLPVVKKFEKEIHEVKAANYSEARLREDYLNPLISALGWDRENHAGLVQAKRE